MTSLSTDSTQPVSQEWLEKLIQQKYETSASISEFASQEIGDKKGYLSVVSRVDLKYAANDYDTSRLPKSLIVKVPTTSKMDLLIESSPHLKPYFNADAVKRLHNREVKAYMLFEEQGAPPIPIPKPLYLEKMDDQHQGMIIMEMVPGTSITFNDDYSSEQRQELTKHIASLHAFCMGRNLEGTFDPLDRCFTEPPLQLLPNSLRKMRSDFPEILGVFTDEQIDRAVKRTKTLLCRLTDPATYGYAPVIAFGDSQPNNVLFEKLESDGSPGGKVAAFLDFQFFHLGSCVFDLCAIVFWGVKSSERAQVSDEILELYHITLSCLAGGKTILSLENLKKEFEEIYPLFVSMYVPMLENIKQVKELANMTDERVDEFASRAKTAFIIR